MSAMDSTFDRTAPPPVGPAPTVELPRVIRHRLSNGLDVVLVEKHDLPVVDLRVVVRTGAAADLPVRAGRASLTADMLDEGTRGYDALTLADAIDHLGAELDTSVSWDASLASLHVLRPRLEPALELLAEVLVHPTFPENELERVRAERLAGFMRRLQEPRFLALKTFSSELYGTEHPYGAPVSGTKESIESLDREALVAFYREHYRPDNAFLVVVGDVEPKSLFTLLERTLEEWTPAPGAAVTLPEPPPAEPTTIYLVDKPGAPQSEIRIGHPSVPRSTPDYFPLLVLNTMLGGSFTSRLNLRLREERGYTYGARSGFDFRRGPGPFVAASSVFTGATDSALAIFLEEIHRIRDEPAPEPEIERARGYLAFGLPRRFETTVDIARTLSEIELYGLGDDYLARFVERIRAVSVEDVQRAAQRHLDPDHMGLVVVGDRAEVEEPLRRLGLGPVVVK